MEEAIPKEENREKRGVEHAANGSLVPVDWLEYSLGREARMEEPCRAKGWEM